MDLRPNCNVEAREEASSSRSAPGLPLTPLPPKRCCDGQWLSPLSTVQDAFPGLGHCLGCGAESLKSLRPQIPSPNGLCSRANPHRFCQQGLEEKAGSGLPGQVVTCLPLTPGNNAPGRSHIPKPLCMVTHKPCSRRRRQVRGPRVPTVLCHRPRARGDTRLQHFTGTPA